MTGSAASAQEQANSVTIITDFNSRTNLTEKEHLGGDYDPLAHRDVEAGTSTGGAFAHLLKCALGTGILAMPMAISNAGLVLGMVGTIAVGFICTYCVRVLVQTSRHICRDARVPSLGFAETAEKVFEYGPKPLRPWANFAKQFVDSAVMATYYASACIYMVFIAASSHDVINHHLGLDWDVRIYIVITLVPCLLIGQAPNLKWLVPFSAMANVLIVVTFAITLYYMFNEPLIYSDKPLVAEVAKIPSFFVTVIFAMEGIGVVMPVENSMKEPQYFLSCPGVLNMAMLFVTVLYSIIGFFGYVRFGDEVRASITLNLPMGTPIADAAKMLMALAMLFTFGLQFFVPNEILWKKIKYKFSAKNRKMAKSILRIGITLAACGISAAIPDLDPFISLVGAIFFSLLGIFVPCMLELIYLWPNKFGWCKWKLIKDVLLCVLSLFALITGASNSIGDIIQLYK